MYQIPEGFGCVEDAIYRACQIHELNLMFLDSLNLKSILYLNPETPSSFLKEHCSTKGIELHHHGLQPWRPVREWKFIGLGTLQDAIKQVLKTTSHPVLIVDSSNLFVGVLRRVQHWAFSTVLSEYNAFAGSRSSYPAELFLEMLETECRFFDSGSEEPDSPQDPKSLKLIVTLPSKENMPAWFLYQQDFWQRINSKK